MNLGACPRIHDAVIPAVFKPESMIRKSFFGAGLDSGLKLAGMTIDTIRPIIGQAPNQNENCWQSSQPSTAIPRYYVKMYRSHPQQHTSSYSLLDKISRD